MTHIFYMFGAFIGSWLLMEVYCYMFLAFIGCFFKEKRLPTNRQADRRTVTL